MKRLHPTLDRFGLISLGIGNRSQEADFSPGREEAGAEA